MSNAVHANEEVVNRFISMLEEPLLIETPAMQPTVSGSGSMNAAILDLADSVTKSEKAFEALVHATSDLVRRSIEEFVATDQSMSKAF